MQQAVRQGRPFRPGLRLCASRQQHEVANGPWRHLLALDDGSDVWLRWLSIGLDVHLPVVLV